MSRLCLLTILICTGCGGRGPLGWIADPEGNRLSTQNPANVQYVHGRRLGLRLQEAIGGDWQVVASIAEEPTWDRMADFDHWIYQPATVLIRAQGPVGTSLSAEQRDLLERTACDYLQDKVQRRSAISITIDDGHANVAPPVTGGPPPTVPATPPASIHVGDHRTYVVQAGDTLADISVAFYGTNRHWRTIAAANPDLDPARITIGTVLKIPAIPAQDATE